MKKLLVILDNGHGVNTPGKRSPDGRLMEWKWTRDFVNLLDSRLKENNISSFILTPEDVDVSLSNRCLRANTIAKNFAALGYETVLISIHNNAAKSDGKWHTASGFTCWVYNKASNKSKQLAALISRRAFQMGLTGNRWIPESGFFEANYYILKNTNMPAILTENMFQDNKEDVDFLLSDKGKEKLVQLHLEAIKDYIKLLNI